MDDDKINSVLQGLYQLAYPRVPHGVHTQIFHDAIDVIAYLRNKVKNSENEKWVLRGIGPENKPLFWCSKKGWVRTPFVQDMAECNEFLPTEDEDNEDTCHD